MMIHKPRRVTVKFHTFTSTRAEVSFPREILNFLLYAPSLHSQGAKVVKLYSRVRCVAVCEEPMKESRREKEREREREP